MGSKLPKVQPASAQAPWLGLLRLWSISSVHLVCIGALLITGSIDSPGSSKDCTPWVEQMLFWPPPTGSESFLSAFSKEKYPNKEKYPGAHRALEQWVLHSLQKSFCQRSLYFILKISAPTETPTMKITVNYSFLRILEKYSWLFKNLKFVKKCTANSRRQHKRKTKNPFSEIVVSYRLTQKCHHLPIPWVDTGPGNLLLFELIVIFNIKAAQNQK